MAREEMIRIELTDEEAKAVRKLAKHDKVSFNQELKLLLLLQIREEIELQEQEKTWR